MATPTAATETRSTLLFAMISDGDSCDDCSQAADARRWTTDGLDTELTTASVMTAIPMTTTTRVDGRQMTAHRWTLLFVRISTAIAAMTARRCNRPMPPTTVSTPTTTAPAMPAMSMTITTESMTAAIVHRWTRACARTSTGIPAMIARWCSRMTPPTMARTRTATASVMRLRATTTATATPTTTRPSTACRPPIPWMPAPRPSTPTVI